jgi:HK97 family phage major capsid protein
MPKRIATPLLVQDGSGRLAWRFPGGRTVPYVGGGAYDNVISRTDAAALIPEDVTNTIMQNVVSQSAALSLFRSVTMSTKQQRMPVLSVLPTAYFVNGDTGLKQTSEQNWANKYLDAEEIAVIVPIPEAVLDDVAFDVWGEVRPRLEEAIGRVLDAAIFFGTNKPASWPTAIVPAAIAAGNVVARGTNNAAAGGVAADLSDTIGTLEADGFDPNGIIAARSIRARLRANRDTTGQLMAEVSPTDAWGVTIRYPMRGMWPTGLSAVEAIVGDFTEGIIGRRMDITYKILTEAVIQDNTGAIIYNLPQQDMVAMRAVARFAWQVPNPMNLDQPTEADRYPFAIMRSPAS